VIILGIEFVEFNSSKLSTLAIQIPQKRSGATTSSDNRDSFAFIL
jgi:hypothetical protein